MIIKHCLYLKKFIRESRRSKKFYNNLCILIQSIELNYSIFNFGTEESKLKINISNSGCMKMMKL